MIRVDRGDEPPGWATIRDAELDRVRVIAEIAEPTSAQIGSRYQELRKVLRERQHFKCCYCEERQRASNRDVEHFRPKSEADRSPCPDTSRRGYWWLAWTWENLLFSCDNCNRYAKRARFPLSETSTPLRAEQEPPGDEEPLLLDPATENGVEHIQFRPTEEDDSGWTPFPRHGSEKGRRTIEICRLDAPDLLDLYDRHVRDNVQPAARAVHEATQERVGDEWRRALRLLAPTMTFVGLSYDALDYFVPVAFRHRHGLRLRLPE